MFIAKKKDIELHSLDVEMVSIPIIELPFVHPLYLCEILEVEEGKINSKILTPKLIPNLESLTAIAISHKIFNIYLISPGYMDNSERWSLKRLKQISRAEYFNENFSSYVYRFELDDGNTLDYDFCGLNKNRNELSFVSILNLSER